MSTIVERTSARTTARRASPAPGVLEDALAAVAAVGLPTRRTASLAAEGVAWELLLGQARQSRLTGFLLESIDREDLEVSPERRAAAERTHVEAMSLSVVLERLLVGMTRTLRDAGVESRVLKGPATAHLDYRSASVRSFGDIDLLVHHEDIDAVGALLRGQAFTRCYPELRPGFDRRYAKSVSYRSAGGLELDVHRTLAGGPFGMRLPVGDLWLDGEAFVLASTDVVALDVDLRLVHACFHAVLGDEVVRLVPLRDVAEILLGGRVDADHVIWLQRRWRTEAVIAEAIVQAWERLGVDAEHPLASWAHDHHPSARDRRALELYRRGGYKPAAVAALHEISAWRSKAGYIRALAFPSTSYLRVRGRTALDHWWHGLSAVAGWRPNSDPTALASASHPTEQPTT